ncbi:NAD-dependent epimerase/dehydratase family protein [bacterium]|nr:NAD-dependent epimerase/dehydratase family protein [bacterium]
MKSQKKETVLVTGSAGLIGSQAVRRFCELGHEVIGIDNNARQYFFGKAASTLWNKKLLAKEFSTYRHIAVDIRNEKRIETIFREHPIGLVVHTAAQPSHDWAAREPITDFTINALGTQILLEACRKHRPDAVFIFTSTNKVYGDNPNSLPLVERKLRFEIAGRHRFSKGIDETMSLDHCTHSIFGVSKTAADLMVQEYGRYFGLRTGVFRGGCLTGPAHSSAQLHGFLAYLVMAITNGKPYTIFGYRGKQVRDNIHASDVVGAFEAFFANPVAGEVYNLGGGQHSNVSVLEAINKIETITGRKADIRYDERNRIGDHIWYVSDMTKFRRQYPKWNYQYDGDQILQELCDHAARVKGR